MTNPQSCLVIGAGLAGLAAAVALASRGVRVTILESRPRLGGRASSFTDPTTGRLVDACQHVSMGCCTNFTHLCRTLGLEHFLEPQPRLWFMTPDGRSSVFKADPWPAPLHLGRALLGAHYLTTTDKVRIAWGMAALIRESPDADPPLLDWLKAHRQNNRCIERFWGVVLTSALNETVDRVGLKYARKVFRDGFLVHRDGFTVHVPTVPLGRFYGDELRTWLDRHGVKVLENKGARRLGTRNSEEGTPRSIDHVELRDGETLSADHYVLAVPFDRVLDLLPESLQTLPTFAELANLQASPITSVHCWFDRPVMDRPHMVLVDCLGQWVFNRGQDHAEPGTGNLERPISAEWYVQVVVSAARPLRGQGREEVQRQIVEELASLFPKVRVATLLRAKVVTEHAATFSAVPGVDRWRPTQASPLPNLALAGDWTATGWPATMEGAVRSGYLAAEVVLQRLGRTEKLLQPDLA